MSNVLINLSGDVVTFGNIFSSNKNYLYKSLFETSIQGKEYTKTLYNSDLKVFRETETGFSITNFTQIPFRESLPPDIPTKGPFIENYSVDGTLNTNTFINLLLIDKPPIRTGYFDFQIGSFTFPGFITRQTTYKHYDWTFTGSKYTYVEQPVNLGYGIEISKNLLYTATLTSDGTYSYSPTALNIFLNSLNGSEDIISFAASSDPNSYLNPISGLSSSSTSSSLPIDLFYISPADALRFIASRSDLILSIGADYYLGQQIYAQEGGTITFDPIAYLNKYNDIRKLYGYNTYDATIHYITTGYYEGRTIENSSGYNSLSGGLYDERVGAINLSDIGAIYPLGQTIASTGSSITYNYNTKKYYLNSSVPVQSNILYLGIN